jgi:hypothetical protein
MEHYRLVGDVHTAIQAVTEGSTKGAYQLAVQSRGTWVYQFSEGALIDLKAEISGKNKQQATQLLLHTAGVQDVSLGNVGTLPSDPQRIHILLLTQQG